mgnify:CR=1 FL=1
MTAMTRYGAQFGPDITFLGVERCLPLFHGSQGCTAFALVLMVRHFREAIPLQTTAMKEGLRTLRQDGIDKVVAGVSTIEEVRASSNA